MVYKNGQSATEEIITESGRTWSQWTNELQSDKFNGLSCDEVEDVLVDEYQVDRVWAKRILDRFSKNGGQTDESRPCFEISVRKTFDYPLERVVANTTEWFAAEKRASKPEVSDSRRLCVQWKTDHSKVAVRFQEKPNGKTQMILSHDRIHSEIDALIMRNFWKENMRGMVETL